jgi:hypothetical protein
MTYFLDSNVLIQSKNFEFSFDETPDFWELILKLGRQKKLAISKEVYGEISKGSDELAKWMKQHKKDLVREPSEDVYASLTNDVLPAYLQGSATNEEIFLETAGADPAQCNITRRQHSSRQQERERSSGHRLYQPYALVRW